jgi:hypothetical protein
VPLSKQLLEGEQLGAKQLLEGELGAKQLLEGEQVGAKQLLEGEQLRPLEWKELRPQ